MDIYTKQCSACKEEKTLEEFHKSKTGKFGRVERCKPCVKLYTTKYRRDNKEQLKESDKIYYRKNKKKISESKKRYYQDNREQLREACKNYYQNNSWKFLSYSGTRRSLRVQATPSWVNKRDIEEIYLEREIISKQTGVVHHVDHIVPLNHPLVCGLHVPWNLRVIPELENLRKSNNFEIDTCPQ